MGDKNFNEKLKCPHKQIDGKILSRGDTERSGTLKRYHFRGGKWKILIDRGCVTQERVEIRQGAFRKKSIRQESRDFSLRSYLLFPDYL